MNEPEQDQRGTQEGGQGNRPERSGQQGNQPGPAGQSGQGHQPGSSDEEDDRQPSRIGPSDEDQVAGTNQDVDKIDKERSPDWQPKRREDKSQR